jgi:hypothetical protein
MCCYVGVVVLTITTYVVVNALVAVILNDGSYIGGEQIIKIIINLNLCLATNPNPN